MLVRDRDAVAAEIDLDDGSVLSIEASAADGARVLLALGLVDPARRRAFELGGGGAFSGCQAVFGGVIAMAVGVCALAALDAAPMPAAYVLGVLFLVPVLVGAWHRSPDRVVIGTDGVRLERLLSRRFHSWSTVEETASVGAKHAWIAVRRGHRVRRIRLSGDDDRGAALAVELREAFEAWQLRDAPTFHAAFLERGSRTIAAWREDIEKACRLGSYRAGFIQTDELARVTADPNAPVSHRVGAALALATLHAEDAMRRAKSALEGVADERVRIAIDLALSAAPDDAALELALDAAQADQATPPM
jgi:hypothetical protein